jgi:outer membrane protein OmpA-like peptidoglycan-associated protein
MADRLSTRYRPPLIGILLCYLLLSTHRGVAQNTEKTSAWYRALFIEAGGIVTLPPELFVGAVNPLFGFRGALGYEWRRLRFSISSGYSQAVGTDPLVENLFFVPLTGRVGYALPIKGNWGAQADLGFGIQFSKIFHYETTLDFLADRRSESLGLKPLIEGRLHATYMLPNNFLKIYAGGGVDIVFETAGPISLPILEVGISLKPFALFSPKKHKAISPVPKPITEPEPEEPYQEPPAEPEPEEPYQEMTAEPEPEEPYQELTAEPEPEEPYQELITEPEPEPEPEEPYQEPAAEMEPSIPDTDIGEETNVHQILFQQAIYFEADRGTRVLAQSLPLLREAGRLLQENPETRITLRGYAARFGTKEGQDFISSARVWFCMEYFKWEYGIAEDRVQMQSFGAEEAPVSDDAEWQLRRRVELIIERN